MATTKNSSTLIPVAQARFLSSKETNWEELFDGYDDIKIITFSSGFAFSTGIISKFRTAEIIFGCDEILNGGFASVLAYQQAFLKALRLDMPTYEALTKRVEDGSLHLWVAHDETSHEKIYLLSSDDGRKRVITGSANLSKSAFEGYQRENIICFDEDEKAYNYFLSRYELLRQYSVDEVTKKVLVAKQKAESESSDDGDDIMDLPVCNTVVKTQEAIVLDGPTDKTEFKTRFALILDNATEVLGIDFFAPAVKKLLHKILADGNNCTVKLNWRRGTCTVKLPDEAIADTVRIELALNGFEIEQTGMTLAVGGIERLATYADVTFKKGFLDSIASIF